jgi:hypothetical protein
VLILVSGNSILLRLSHEAAGLATWAKTGALSNDPAMAAASPCDANRVKDRMALRPATDHQRRMQLLLSNRHLIPAASNNLRDARWSPASGGRTD